MGRLKKVVKTKSHSDVTFAVREDAINAVQKYNGVTLDGAPLRVALLKPAHAAGGAAEVVRFTVSL